MKSCPKHNLCIHELFPNFRKECLKRPLFYLSIVSLSRPIIKERWDDIDWVPHTQNNFICLKNISADHSKWVMSVHKNAI